MTIDVSRREQWAAEQINALIDMGDLPADAERFVRAALRLIPIGVDPYEYTPYIGDVEQLSVVSPLDIQDAQADWFVRDDVPPEYKRILHAREVGESAEGGPGSGHHGHRGIPGQQGGSLPGDGTQIVKAKVHAERLNGKAGSEFFRGVRDWPAGIRHNLAFTAVSLISAGMSGVALWDEEELVGIANYRFAYHNFRYKDTGEPISGMEIELLVTKRGGYGRKMMLELARIALDEAEPTPIVLKALPTAEGFYEKMGLEECDSGSKALKGYVWRVEDMNDAVTRTGESITEWEPESGAFASTDDAYLKEGGPGSGHHGHRGRQGKIGGSLPNLRAEVVEPSKEASDALREETSDWEGDRGGIVAGVIWQMARVEDWEYNKRAGIGGAEGLFLRQGDEIVGASFIKDHGIRTDRYWRIKRYKEFYVSYLATKRKGYGRRMMAEIAKYALARKPEDGTPVVVELFSVNDAVGFYEKIGMERPWDSNDFYWDEEAMRSFIESVRESADYQDDDEPESGAFAEGGPGSGHFGHKGRPGHKGGSLPSDTLTLTERGAALAALREMRSATVGELSEEEWEALKGYCRSYFADISNVLRKGEAPRREHTERYVRTLDALMRRASLSRPSLVYRALAARHVPDVGAKFLDQGFGSYTLDRDVAEKYTLDTDGDDEFPTVVEMLIGKGIAAIPVSDAGYDSEFEILLHRGAAFRVVSERYEPINSDGARRMRIATIEYLGGSDFAREALRDESGKQVALNKKFLWDEGDIVILSAVAEGGPGSGHHGHKGRPGKVGGSAPSDEGGAYDGRLGRCYELSAKYVTDHQGYELVHGFITDRIKSGRTIDHAWAEKENEVYDPVIGQAFDKGLYYALFGAEPVERYTQDEARIRALDSGHWGPWHEVDQSKVNWWPDNQEAMAEGGPGSGHFGHKGRPGKVGGSAPSKGAGVEEPETEAPLAYDFQNDNGSDIRRQLREVKDATLSEHLTQEESSALRLYTSDTYRPINRYLRKGHAPDLETMDAVRDIDSAMEKARLSRSLQLYRGVKGRYAKDLEEGVIFTDTGFGSYSMSSQTASAFYDPRSLEGAILSVVLPAGAPAIPLTGSLSHSPSELEVLLDRDARFRVVRVAEEHVWKKDPRYPYDTPREAPARFVYVEYLGQVEEGTMSLADILPESGEEEEESRFVWYDGDLVIEGKSAEGGPGSGHFGHKGRPGKQGGSLPGDAGDAVTVSQPSYGGDAVTASPVVATSWGDTLQNQSRFKNKIEPSDELFSYESLGGAARDDRYLAADSGSILYDIEGLKEASLSNGALTNSEAFIIEKYTETYYQNINRYLRGGEDAPKGENLIAKVKERVAIIDGIMARTALARPVKLYRGMKGKYLGEVGDKITDRGFGSSSLIDQVAALLGNQLSGSLLPSRAEEVVVCEFVMPRGSRVLPLGGASAQSAEAEFVIDRGAQYRVVSKRTGMTSQAISVFGKDPVKVTFVELEFLGFDEGAKEAASLSRSGGKRARRDDKFVWGDGDLEIERGVFAEGGPGSGHHGHRGRPGKVGGSLPSWEASLSSETRDLLAVAREYSENKEDRALGVRLRAALARIFKERRKAPTDLRLDDKDARTYPIMEPKNVERLDEAERWLATHLSPDMVTSDARIYIHPDTQRFSSFPDQGLILMGTQDAARYADALIHEYAHIVEFNSKAAVALSVAFREARTRGEKPQLLRDLTGKPYAINEVAKPDRFIHCYVGKSYPDDATTEVFSLGAEWLFKNASEFAREDPEHFAVTVEILSGAVEAAEMAEGGPGSGHFGHRGIPGHQGGSLPSDGGDERPTAQDKGGAVEDERPADWPYGTSLSDYVKMKVLSKDIPFDLRAAVNVAGGEAARAVHEEAMNESIDEVTTEESRALAYYTWLGYQSINAHMRGSKDGPNVSDTDKKHAEVLTALTNRARLSRPMRLYRGMSGKHLPDVGEKFTDHGLGSFSMDHSVAFEAAERNRSWKTVLEVVVPKGIPALPIAGGASAYEYEVLFAPNSQFRVISKEPTYSWEADEGKKPWTQHWSVKVEYLGIEQAQAEAEAVAVSSRGDYRTDPKPIDRFCWHDGDLVITSAAAEGGPGSGHFGHKGRPGQRGGSLPSDRQAVEEPDADMLTYAPAEEEFYEKSLELDELKKASEKGVHDLERDAIELYCNRAHTNINRHLRGKEVKGKESEVRQELAAIKRLDSAAKKTRLARSVRLYRGAKGSGFPAAGETFVDDGFGSFSLGADTAYQLGQVFSGTRNVRDVVVAEVVFPKGANAIIPGRDSRNWPELEIIAPRGTAYRVISKEERDLPRRGLQSKWEGVTVVTLEHIGSQEASAEAEVIVLADEAGEHDAAEKFFWDEGDIRIVE